MHELVSRILQGDRRAVARAITTIEDDASSKPDLLRDLHPHTGQAYLIGITGAPGAGKSSLTDQLLFHLRKAGLLVGVIAVDPTSPFTGGAILGDRVRMVDHALDPGVFIRSMGTRGSLGGLAQATKEAIRVLDAFGMHVILIETVGVGQSELDIMNVADTTVVVLNPTAGDHIQTMKAGIMEIADLFVVNKADLSGADKTVTEVNNMLDLIHDFDFRPPVLKTVSVNRTGISELWEACQQHRTFLENSGLWEEKRRRNRQEEIVEIVNQRIQRRVRDLMENDPVWDTTVSRVVRGESDPYQAADELWEKLFNRD